MILDSTFLIDVLRDAGEIGPLVEELDTTETPFVSTVTVMELWEGIHLTVSMDEERESVKELLTGLTEIPFDRQCAMRAGRINAGLVSSGEPIDETDVMIAATALVHDQSVTTRNVDHFDRIDGLDVVSY